MGPKLYDQLADWWPLLSHPADYAEEAEFFGRTLRGAGNQPARTLLELGSGGGNNASHLKREFEMTLVDLSPGMLAVSRALNPECAHVQGDMRHVRLGRQFDRVLIHDAIAYMTSKDDLRMAMQTAYEHLRPGGAALFVPDFVRENFKADTSHGGHDGEGRSLRYLQWTWDPDPSDDTIVVDFAYMLREGGGAVMVEHDRHINGLFSQGEWLRLMSDVGFCPSVVPFEHSEFEPGTHVVFVGEKPSE